MGTVDYASIVREGYQAFDAKDVERYSGLILPDGKVTVVPFGMVLSFRDYFQNWAKAFPDGKCEVVTILCQGEKVMSEFIGRGTHTGPLNGPGGVIPATGKNVEIRFAESVELKNGKMASSRVYFDNANFMAQLGLSPLAMSKAATTTATATPAH